jgi:putative ABC transport system ATP-binding protein
VVIVSHDERLKDVADRVLWLEDGTFREMTEMARDPICGMTVSADHTTSIHLRRGADTWWFCSASCREEFVG